MDYVTPKKLMFDILAIFKASFISKQISKGEPPVFQLHMSTLIC